MTGRAGRMLHGSASLNESVLEFSRSLAVVNSPCGRSLGLGSSAEESNRVSCKGHDSCTAIRWELESWILVLQQQGTVVGWYPGCNRVNFVNQNILHLHDQPVTHSNASHYRSIISSHRSATLAATSGWQREQDLVNVRCILRWTVSFKKVIKKVLEKFKNFHTKNIYFYM